MVFVDADEMDRKFGRTSGINESVDFFRRMMQEDAGMREVHLTGDILDNQAEQILRLFELHHAAGCTLEDFLVVIHVSFSRCTESTRSIERSSGGHLFPDIRD